MPGGGSAGNGAGAPERPRGRLGPRRRATPTRSNQTRAAHAGRPPREETLPLRSPRSLRRRQTIAIGIVLHVPICGARIKREGQRVIAQQPIERQERPRQARSGRWPAAKNGAGRGEPADRADPATTTPPGKFRTAPG